MEIGEILSDALAYPFHNIKALAIYLILGIILGIALILSFGAVIASANVNNIIAAFGSGIIGAIVVLFLAFLISGYELDIMKYGIERSNGAPGIDFVRQFINGVKLFAVQIVYYLIPIIISAILAAIFQHWLSGLLSFILFIVFSFAALMGQCRLAKTEDIGFALNIPDAIGDIARIGILKLVIVIVLILIIAVVLYFIVFAIAQWSDIIGGILVGILGVYLTFFISRALGLLYSDV